MRKGKVGDNLRIKEIIKNLKNPGGNLSQRAIRGGFWVFSLKIIQQLFSLTKLIIIARILAPQDFGLMGIALLTMATLETFSQTGFQVALIQKKEDIKSYLDAAWTFLILRGFILFALLYLAAPYVAIFFDVPEVKPILQVIGFSILFQAFTNIGVIYFQKELEFNKEFIYQFVGTLADFIVAIIAVLILGNVWALVLGLLAGNFVRFIMSYLIHPYRPNLSFDIEKIKELFGFGKWVLGSSILVFLLTQGDDILVGKLLGATALGFYQMAYRISNMPATHITHVISQVSFPIYSKLQHDIPKLQEAFLKVLQLTAFLSFPIAGLIFVLAPDFTMIFLGEKWMPMVPAMQVLCIFGALRAIAATMGPIFYSVGKPKFITWGSTVQFIILAMVIYPLTIKWGILGASISIIIPNLLVILYMCKKLINIIACKSIYFINSLFPQIVGSIIMSVIITFLKFEISGTHYLVSVIFIIFFGISFYLGVMYVLDKVFNYGLINNLKQLLV